MKHNDKKKSKLSFALILSLAMIFLSCIIASAEQNSIGLKIAKATQKDLCVCAMLSTLNDENHNDGKCDYCRKGGTLFDRVKTKHVCGHTYELHSECAGIILDNCKEFD